ncbi:hypothetical protein PROFUN_12743 [Planoprotostelium fungivorum]|uniref:Guanylate cyclase domain-containing protein n=1 Tax=Planoprotostelium fungivorum TaxID=1890364 RepID=A0A2P6N8I5_9EUKA|nr:hypothetical protein PROFUN_12743 [Planoprotostelium fungivorum]
MVVAVASILVASAIIGAIGVVRQQELLDSSSQAQFTEVTTNVQSQVKNLLSWPDDSVTLSEMSVLEDLKMTSTVNNYLQRTNISFNSDRDQKVRDVYRSSLEMMVSLCSSKMEGCLSTFYWPNGKVWPSLLSLLGLNLSVIRFGERMDIWENIIYNSSYTPLSGWFMNESDDLSQVFNGPSDFGYQFSAVVNRKPSQGVNCSSPRWWSDLATFPAYDPPIMIIGQNSVFCRNNTLIGYIKTCVELNNIQKSLQDALANGQNGMLFLVEGTGKIVATSTGLFPYDLQLSTNPRHGDEHKFELDLSILRSLQSNISEGVNHLIYVKPDIAPYPDLDWTVFILSVQPVDHFVRNVVLIAFFTCIGAAILVFVATFLITRSLFHLSHELEKVSRLELDLNDLSEPPIWEAQRLYKSFIMMHAALSSFRKFVPIELISHIMKSRREAFPYLYPTQATIYFQDIKDFTRLAETEEPDVLAAITEEYMEAMTTIIIDNGGMVDKYIGDCIMALFNLPKPQAGHEQAATRAALECTEQLQLLNKRWKKLYNIELQHRIGINTGEVLAGNIGSSQRLAFTCIGDNVNLASRVEGANKCYHTTVLITDTTHEKIDRQTFTTRKIGTVRVAGKKRETVLYEVSNHRSQEFRDLCQSYEYALQLYDERKLHEAKTEVEILLDHYGYDAVSVRLLGRINVALERGEAWSVIEVLDK